MATEEQISLAEEIKGVHKGLRDRTRKFGADKAWCEHLKSKAKLEKYATAMKDLATKYWEENDKKSLAKAEARSRISWSVNYCLEYFLKEKTLSHLRERESRIEMELTVEKIGNDREAVDVLPVLERIKLIETNKIDLLDVGSCYNPFKKYPEFKVTAIDIAPAVEDVIECDFLNVEIIEASNPVAVDPPAAITYIPKASFDVIVFSLLLEYLPTSEQRILCCEKAYHLLRPEGLLIIVTPDSKHVGANAKLMKTWRYTLALIGFNRVKYEKLEHISCMAFRKCLNSEVAKRWARIHKQEYMDFKIEIPQDRNETEEIESAGGNDVVAVTSTAVQIVN